MNKGIYNLYECDGYGKNIVIKSSANVEVLKELKNDLFFKKYVLPTILTLIVVVIISILIGSVVGVDDMWFENKHLSGAWLGFMFGIALSIIICLIGIMGGSIDFDNYYVIEYNNDTEK